MALSNVDLDLLKTLYGRCDLFESLEPTDARYQPVYQSGDREDPVSRLKAHIDFSPVESLQLFSGFRGSGKTTELFRLRADLKQAGCAVIYANALEYLNPAEPVEISDLLMVIAGAFSDRLKEDFDVDLLNESFWRRITGYLQRTSLSVTEATASVEADSPAKEVLGGLKTGLEVKLALKEASSFRQRLRQFLENRLTELKSEVNRSVEQGVKALRQKRGKDVPIVFIFDQLEQLRGSASNEREVIYSVERTFASHLDKLRLPYVHAVYSVPPWLQFVLPGGVDIEVLPSFRIWQNNPDRTRDDDGWNQLRKLLFKRFGAEGFSRVFGASPGQESHPLADQLIAASGGYFRDLLRIIRELLVRIRTQSQAMPATEELVKGAIQRVREQYSNLSEEDALWLEQVETTRACVPVRASAEEAARLSRLLDLHLVFYFSNGEEWYDVHPLVRKDAAAIVSRLKKRASAEPSEPSRRNPPK